MIFLVYWVPKNEYAPLEQREKLKEFEITDSHSNSSVHCTLEYKDSKLILNFEPPFLGNLERLDFDCLYSNVEEGFFIFSTNEHIHSHLENLLREKIYHNFKELFHSHEHHGADEDVILKGFIYNTESKSLEEFIKVTIFELLKFYRNKFKARNRELVDIITEIKSKNLDNLDILLESLKNSLSTLGEKTYFNFLYELAKKYNLNEKDLEKILFDVKNLSRNIEILRETLKLKKELYDSEKDYYQSNLGITATIFFSSIFFIAGILTKTSILIASFIIVIGVLFWIMFKDILNQLLSKKFIPEEVYLKIEKIINLVKSILKTQK